jgi:hypothetical protein
MIVLAMEDPELSYNNHQFYLPWSLDLEQHWVKTGSNVNINLSAAAVRRNEIALPSSSDRQSHWDYSNARESHQYLE